MEAVRSELLSEKELAEKSQKEMEADLIKTKHRYSNSMLSHESPSSSTCFVAVAHSLRAVAV